MVKDAPPRWDRRMQQRLARGEAAALGELYDRFAALVHSQAHRMLEDEDAADQVTREVFGHVWEHPDTYDPRNGSMRSWVARLTHREAVRRLPRRPGRGRGTRGGRAGRGAGTAGAPRDRRRPRRLHRRLHARTAAGGPELAYIQRRDYRQTAADLGVTGDEARRRLRLGLQLLSTADARTPAGSSPPGYGPAS